MMVVAKAKPDPKSFEDQMAEKTLEELLCRVIHHAWEPATLEVAPGLFVLGNVCSRCRKEKERFRHWSEQKTVNKYWDPPDSTYAFDRLGRLTNEQRRSIEETVADELRGTLPRPDHSNREAM